MGATTSIVVSQRGWLAGLIGAAGAAAVTWAALYAHGARRGATVGGQADPIWPGPAAPLRAPDVAFPAGFGLRRIYLDAGHGAPGNKGNTSCFCVEEQDFTDVAARALAYRLEATGHFEVRLSREGDESVEYRERVEDAELWGAEVFVSLHSDVRGKFDRWSPEPGMDCPTSVLAPGFSVLWSDEGDPALVAHRVTLARAVAGRMHAAGLPPYGGATYEQLYELDATTPGVFVDRHAPDQRIFVLRRTTMPAVLIETHHALDPREAERWTEPRTFDAFGAAIAAALVETLGPLEPPPTP